MRKISFVLAIAVLAAGMSYAAEGDSGSTVPPRKVIGGAHMIGGGLWGDVGKLNDALADMGYSGLKDYSYNIGFGMQKAHGRLIHGLELKGIAWRPTDNATSVTELYGASGLINIGFNVLPPDGKFWLYPYAGFGFGYHTLRLRAEKATLAEALAQPVHDVMLSQKTAAIQVGAGFDFRMPTRHDPSKSRVVGVRAGYLFDPSKEADWRVNETEVSGGPDLSVSGVYAQLVIGHTKTRPMKAWKKGCPKQEECKTEK